MDGLFIVGVPVLFLLVGFFMGHVLGYESGYGDAERKARKGRL